MDLVTQGLQAFVNGGCNVMVATGDMRRAAAAFLICAVGGRSMLSGVWTAAETRVRRPLFALRGGGGETCAGSRDEPLARARTHAVPSAELPTLQDGLDATCKGDTCQVSRGRHSFGLPGPFMMEDRSLCLRGEEGSWVLGRWFSEESEVNMTQLSLYADQNSDTEGDEAMRGRVVQIAASSWVLSSSSIQCVDGVSLGVTERSTVEMEECVLGGAAALDERLARLAIIVGDHCKVTLRKSTITWCKQFGICVEDDALL
jgi:hypothetical protein